MLPKTDFWQSHYLVNKNKEHNFPILAIEIMSLNSEISVHFCLLISNSAIYRTSYKSQMPNRPIWKFGTKTRLFSIVKLYVENAKLIKYKDRKESKTLKTAVQRHWPTKRISLTRSSSLSWRIWRHSMFDNFDIFVGR